MQRKIKIIWDFHGTDAEGTAQHHAIHLDEFAKRNNVVHFGCGSENEVPNHFLAYIVVEEKDMIAVRDALKPHRAELNE